MRIFYSLIISNIMRFQVSTLFVLILLIQSGLTKPPHLLGNYQQPPPLAAPPFTLPTNFIRNPWFYTSHFKVDPQTQTYLAPEEQVASWQELATSLIQLTTWKEYCSLNKVQMSPNQRQNHYLAVLRQEVFRQLRQRIEFKKQGWYYFMIDVGGFHNFESSGDITLQISLEGPDFILLSKQFTPVKQIITLDSHFQLSKAGKYDFEMFLERKGLKAIVMTNIRIFECRDQQCRRPKPFQQIQTPQNAILNGKFEIPQVPFSISHIDVFTANVQYWFIRTICVLVKAKLFNLLFRSWQALLFTDKGTNMNIYQNISLFSPGEIYVLNFIYAETNANFESGTVSILFNNVQIYQIARTNDSRLKTKTISMLLPHSLQKHQNSFQLNGKGFDKPMAGIMVSNISIVLFTENPHQQRDSQESTKRKKKERNQNSKKDAAGKSVNFNY